MGGAFFVSGYLILEVHEQAQEVAAYCEQWGYRYEEILGSDTYVRRLIEVAAALDKADGDFVVVPPGGEIKQTQFMR